MGALLEDGAVFEDEDAVGHADGGEAVGDEDGHAVAGEFGETEEDVVFGAGVEGGGGLVEDDELGVAHVGAGEGDFLPLAGGEVGAAVEAPAEHVVVAAGELGGDGVGEGFFGGVTDAGEVVEGVDVAEADVFLEEHVVTHVVLEDDADLAAQGVDGIVAEIDTVEEDDAVVGIVEAGEEFDEGGFAGAVFADKGEALLRVEAEAEVAEGEAAGAGIAEGDVAELKAGADGAWGGDGGRGADEAGLHAEEVVEIGEIESLVSDIADGGKQPLHDGAAALEGGGKEGEITDGERAGEGAVKEDGVGGIVAGGAEDVEGGAGEGAAGGEAAVFGVETIGEGAVTAGKVRSEAEDFDFLGALVGGAEHADVVQFAALGCPTVEEGIGKPGEVGFAEEAGNHGEQEHEQEPRGKPEQAGGEGNEGEGILGKGGNR